MPAFANPAIVERTRKRLSEDAVRASDRVMVVVDGESPLDPTLASNAAVSRFAGALANALAEHLPGDGTARDLLARSIERAQRKTGSHGASAALAALRISGDQIEAIVLGDSVALVDEGRVAAVSDPAFLGSERSILSRASRRIRRGADPADAYLEIMPDLARARTERNVEGGLWLAADSGDPEEMARRAQLRSFPAHAVRRAMACTDGAWRMVDVFGIVSASQLAAASGDRVAQLALLERLKTAEDQDPERRRHPRLSLHDDIGIASARVSAVAESERSKHV